MYSLHRHLAAIFTAHKQQLRSLDNKNDGAIQHLQMGRSVQYVAQLLIWKQELIFLWLFFFSQ